MKKSTKIAIVSVSILALGGLGYYLYSKNKKSQDSLFKEEDSSESEMTNDELKSLYQNECSAPSMWKARGALSKGLLIQPEWDRDSKYDGLSNCHILEWMYHIRYESSWGKNKRGKELYKAALHQANEQKKKGGGAKYY